MSHNHQHHHHHHHEHGHDHQHGHCNGHDLGEANKNHFDETANTAFQADWVIKISNQTAEEIKAHTEWLGLQNHTKMLDYACGDGLASRIFAPHFKTIRGVDISSNMVAEYNKRIAKEGLPTDNIFAVHGDFINPEATPSTDVSSPEYFNFDLIVISMALHHVRQPEVLVQKFSERLAEGGVLLVIDWLLPKKGEEERKMLADSPDHPAKKTISTHGFTEEEFAGYFKGSGLEGVKVAPFQEDSEIPQWGGAGSLFNRICLARAEKKKTGDSRM